MLQKLLWKDRKIKMITLAIAFIISLLFAVSTNRSPAGFIALAFLVNYSRDAWTSYRAKDGHATGFLLAAAIYFCIAVYLFAFRNVYFVPGPGVPASQVQGADEIFLLLIVLPGFHVIYTAHLGKYQHKNGYVQRYRIGVAFTILFYLLLALSVTDVFPKLWVLLATAVVAGLIALILHPLVKEDQKENAGVY